MPRSESSVMERLRRECRPGTTQACHDTEAARVCNHSVNKPQRRSGQTPRAAPPDARTTAAPGQHGARGHPHRRPEQRRRPFGDFAKFKETLSTAATSRLGIGWAWLVLAHGQIEVIGTTNKVTQQSDRYTPTLGL